MWAEIPIDYGSNEFEEFLKKYRSYDDDRTHRWNLNVDEKCDDVTFNEILNNSSTLYSFNFIFEMNNISQILCILRFN